MLRLNRGNYKLKEVAYFDTYPADTIAQFAGTWSNFPYFRSGKFNNKKSKESLYIHNDVSSYIKHYKNELIYSFDVCVMIFYQ